MAGSAVARLVMLLRKTRMNNEGFMTPGLQRRVMETKTSGAFGLPWNAPRGPYDAARGARRGVARRGGRRGPVLIGLYLNGAVLHRHDGAQHRAFWAVPPARYPSA